MTYQGNLNFNGAPANGSFDVSFSVYVSSNGSPVDTIEQDDVVVVGGLISTTLYLRTGRQWSGAMDRSKRSIVGNGNIYYADTQEPLSATPYALLAYTETQVRRGHQERRVQRDVGRQAPPEA